MRLTSTLRGGSFALLMLLAAGGIFAAQLRSPGQKPETEMPSVTTVPVEAQPSTHFNAEMATDAYLAEIPASARAKSDAYFVGGYWLILWDFLYGAVWYLILLRLRVSAAMRNVAERVTRFKPFVTLIYWAEFMIVSTIVAFPLNAYESYFRERRYGLATQTFGPWLGDQFKFLLVNVILGGLLAMLLFGVVRKLPGTWHVWGAIVTMLFSALVVMIAPVYLVTLFNTPKKLESPKITQPILRLARANGIPARDVYEIDASKQTTRMSANVSGLGSTMRITISDNLISRGSQEEIQSVMGHEMGHYVLHHIYKDLLFISVVIVVFFSFLKWALERTLARWGELWQVRGVTDVAVVPLVFLVGSLFFFVLTPIQNTETRTNEYEADMYGLNASRQPDGFAQAAIHLGEYRKMDPGPVEEFIFYDHPSGRNRIYRAMRWKAENLQLFREEGAPTAPAARSTATSPQR